MPFAVDADGVAGVLPLLHLWLFGVLYRGVLRTTGERRTFVIEFCCAAACMSPTAAYLVIKYSEHLGRVAPVRLSVQKVIPFGILVKNDRCSPRQEVAEFVGASSVHIGIVRDGSASRSKIGRAIRYPDAGRQQSC